MLSIFLSFDYIAILSIVAITSVVILIGACTSCFGYKLFHNTNEDTADLNTIEEGSSRRAVITGDETRVMFNRHGESEVIQIEPLPVNITPSHALPTPVALSSVLEYLPSSDGQSSELIRECADWFYNNPGFPRNKLQYEKEIGRGWFGRIVLGEMYGKQNFEISLVAIKILKKNVSERDKKQYLNECKLFRELCHPNILKVIGYNISEEPWLIIFDFYASDMKEYLKGNMGNKEALNEKAVPLNLMMDVSTALSYIHSKGFVHGDVSCRCVHMRLRSDRPQAVLGGLGDAAGRYPADYSHGIPLRWAAPEQLLRAPYTVSIESDCWSLGVLLWEVCEWGARPFDELSDETVAEGLRAHLQTDTDARPLLLDPPQPGTPHRYYMYKTMKACWRERSVRANASWVCERLRNAPYAPRVPSPEPDILIDVNESMSIVKSPAIENFQNISKDVEFPKVDENEQEVQNVENVSNNIEPLPINEIKTIDSQNGKVIPHIEDIKTETSVEESENSTNQENSVVLSPSDNQNSNKIEKTEEMHQNEIKCEECTVKSDKTEDEAIDTMSLISGQDNEQIIDHLISALRNELILKLPLAQQQTFKSSSQKGDESLTTITEEDVDETSNSNIDSSVFNFTVISMPPVPEIKLNKDNGNDDSKNAEVQNANDLNTESELVTITSPCLAHENTIKNTSNKENHISKSISMNSWCSNDTLFNVDDNFDEVLVSENDKSPDKVVEEISYSNEKANKLKEPNENLLESFSETLCLPKIKQIIVRNNIRPGNEENQQLNEKISAKPGHNVIASGNIQSHCKKTKLKSPVNVDNSCVSDYSDTNLHNESLVNSLVSQINEDSKDKIETDYNKTLITAEASSAINTSAIDNFRNDTLNDSENVDTKTSHKRASSAEILAQINIPSTSNLCSNTLKHFSAHELNETSKQSEEFEKSYTKFYSPTFVSPTSNALCSRLKRSLSAHELVSSKRNGEFEQSYCKESPSIKEFFSPKIFSLTSHFLKRSSSANDIVNSKSESPPITEFYSPTINSPLVEIVNNKLLKLSSAAHFTFPRPSKTLSLPDVSLPMTFASNYNKLNGESLDSTTDNLSTEKEMSIRNSENITTEKEIDFSAIESPKGILLPEFQGINSYLNTNTEEVLRKNHSVDDLILNFNKDLDHQSANQGINYSSNGITESDESGGDSNNGSSSSEDFIWKDGDRGVCITLTTSTDFANDTHPGLDYFPSSPKDSSGDERDNEELILPSWDCNAVPSKSSLKKHPSEVKKQVNFKEEEFLEVYEYPAESPYQLDAYFLYSDLYVSALARPMLASEFHPVKLFHGHVTPDSGVDDLTPATTADDPWNFNSSGETTISETPTSNTTGESSSNGSVVIASELGGLRHTRDKLTLQLQPSSPRSTNATRNIFSYDNDSCEEDSGFENCSRTLQKPCQ